MMEITMTKHAMEALTKKVGKDSKIALALIDSSDLVQKAVFSRLFLSL